MKIYIYILLLIFTGCSAKNNAQHNIAVAAQNDNIKEVVQEPQSQNIEVDYMNFDEQNKQDIMLAYGTLLDDANVNAWAKGTEANLVGKILISQATFNKIANEISQYIRDFRKIDGKISIYYQVKEKVVYQGKY
ncbi:hypothetical protein BIU14_01015 [Campylobacter fetus]|uniref:hypothetical protein n=1 Tax=Campylobacter fetus TaxID=196 RepID=UPI0005317A75|nr:hypothetical protein [Campylobacter fetus]EAI5647610.1 hypothetical protein [Campylobacter fetus]EAI5945780.1 hypothetical protein [Campylobacter fetus]EAJ0319522.1 hypothetical protein [Campylobacter fetus]EAJ0345326.1 hypothetical protein [Campylobacter fetus]EAJ1238249.1 hypothetical protein [Campylobacter fetus]